MYLIITNRQTWGNGRTELEAMTRALSHCSSMRPPTQIQRITYKAENTGDVFVDEAGYLNIKNGAQLTESLDWQPLPSNVWGLFQDFYIAVDDAMFALDELEEAS